MNHFGKLARAASLICGLTIASLGKTGVRVELLKNPTLTLVFRNNLSDKCYRSYHWATATLIAVAVIGLVSAPLQARRLMQVESGMWVSSTQAIDQWKI